MRAPPREISCQPRRSHPIVSAHPARPGGFVGEDFDLLAQSERGSHAKRCRYAGGQLALQWVMIRADGGTTCPCSAILGIVAGHGVPAAKARRRFSARSVSSVARAANPRSAQDSSPVGRAEARYWFFGRVPEKSSMI